MPQALVPHPVTPCPALERIEAEIGADAHGAVRLQYTLIGDAERVIAAPAGPDARPRHRDGLWHRTCCELFVQDPAGPGYREYDFAPSGDWAVYRFTDYRSGGTSFGIAPPSTALERSRSALTLTVTLTDHRTEDLAGRRVGLACIVESPAGLSYWALAHVSARPDFHDARSFVLTPARERAAQVEA